MAKNDFIQLGDLFPDRQITCGVRGCNNLCVDAEDVPGTLANDDSIPDSLCDRCVHRLQELSPKNLPCSTPGCDGTWACPSIKLLEQELGDSKRDPIGFCETCREKLAKLQDKPVPCQLEECDNTWTWSAREQMSADSDTPPDRYCKHCENELKKLHDRSVPCRVQGCEETWIWSALEQLRSKRRGDSRNGPPTPSKTCEKCRKILETLKDKLVPCRVKGCTRTWVFDAEAQHQHHIMHGPDSPAPKRMCRECYEFYQKSEDRLVRCQVRGCHGRCLYSRRHQLEDFASGTSEPPGLLCKKCRVKIQHLEDKDVACSVPGCDTTWKYTAKEQFLDSAGRRSPRIPERRCKGCDEFLLKSTTKTLKCSDCGCDISWSSYEQLLHEKGGFTKPERCPDCNLKKMPEKPEVNEKVQHHSDVFQVRVPAKGPWLRDKALADWPPRMTHDVLQCMESAQARIVIVANDCDTDDSENAWPRRLPETLEKTAVVDVGIPHTTSQQVVTRFKRDIEPFAPRFVIFAMAISDSCMHHAQAAKGSPRSSQDESEKAAAKLCSLCQTISAMPVFLVPHPVFPEWLTETEKNDRNLRDWEKKQNAEFRQRVAALSHVFRENGAKVLDFRPRFEVNGQRSARKWMSDWRTPNETGHSHIATWLVAELKKCGTKNPEPGEKDQEPQ
jgi:hypothetical protein